ncbi:DUF3347 domain-containing protein [Niastella caeni]|uniref:DUF3347 domain-containing protein n=1 Tax=Niastella caeni TaxID=2569763 RepID=A0A4S8HRK0_9BACT|nr:DUF3347 domain-containing protein [Niastella caeni]THU38137.1 DUF3347 domain-containing protein [Niastella caeni]
MKHIALSSAFAIVLFTACNNNSKQANSGGSDTAQSAPAANTETAAVQPQSASPVKDIVSGYLQLKNALASDNGNDAATAGNTMVAAFENLDKSALPTEKKKTYEDIEADAKEHAEHIGKNGSNIKHQREHFDMLSKDMYELVKTFGASQQLYVDHCPMYNNNKGADWISEKKEISNPYFGKEMPTCGTVKEELK